MVTLAFHGTALTSFQHPDSASQGEVRSQTILPKVTDATQKQTGLSETYTNIQPTILKNTVLLIPKIQDWDPEVNQVPIPYDV